MIKNNIKCLLIHLLVSILCFIIFLVFHLSTAKWASEKAAQSNHFSMLIVSIVIIAVAIYLYYSLSKKICKNQGGSFNNIISVSITSILSVFLWLLAYNIDLTGGTKVLLNSELWQFYSLFNTYCLFFVDEARINNPFVMLIFSFIPVLSMGYGIIKKELINNI